MPVILITGANRGIGQALAQAYLADGWEVIGTCRDLGAANNPAVTWLQLDVTSAASIRQLAADLKGKAIDVLWNNAGVYLDKGLSLSDITTEIWLKTFEVNAIAPIRLAEALAANVLASERKAFAFTSSRMGSITQNSGGAYAYRASKAALNMAVSCFFKDQAQAGASCVVLHPGWVRTDMGGSGADIDVTTSATGMKSVVDQMNPVTQDKFSGTFFNYDGQTFPW